MAISISGCCKALRRNGSDFLYQKEIERPGKRENKGEGERGRGRKGEGERWRDEGGVGKL